MRSILKFEAMVLGWKGMELPLLVRDVLLPQMDFKYLGVLIMSEARGKLTPQVTHQTY